MPEGRQGFSLELVGGPTAVRLLRPSDWETVSGTVTFELEVKGYGDLDIRFIEAGGLSDIGESRSSGTSIACSGARGLLKITPPKPLAVGPNIVQVVRRYDGQIMATTAVMVALDAEERQSALRRISAMRAAISAPPPSRQAGRPMFSITTTAWDTPPRFLAELAERICNQSWADFEWLVLDNGSTDSKMVETLAGLVRQDNRVRHFRVEQNIHIIPGNRYLLERATGDFIVPMDSDDVPAFDALERLSAYIAQEKCPALLYSDELKITENGEPLELLWRSAVDPLGAIATCPASHLMAFSRQAALQADVYGDAYAQGSHDWDTYLRLTDRGERALHIPEVLYGWRVHATSAAGDDTVKDYLVESQRAVVERSLSRRGLGQRFDVGLASSEIRIGYFHATRRPLDLPQLDLDIVVRNDPLASNLDNVQKILETCDGATVVPRVVLVGRHADPSLWPVRSGIEVVVAVDEGKLATTLWHSHRRAAFKAVIDSELRPICGDWLRDAIGTMELDEAVGIVGGRVTDHESAILHIGFVIGLDGLAATPNPGGQLPSPTKHAAFCRRRVSAVYGGLMLLRTRLLDQIGPPGGVDGDDAFHGIEYCLRARAAGWEVGYCPTFATERSKRLLDPAAMSPSQRAMLQERYGEFLVHDPYYSALLSTRASSYGALQRI